MTAYPPLHPTDANFAAIRARNGLYVDKTPHFRNLLATEGEDVLVQPELAVRHQLLLRPRRFGKTLLLNMLEAWFQGLPPRLSTRLPAGRDTLSDMPEGWRSPSWLWDGLDGADWHGVHGWHPVVKLDMSRVAPENPLMMRDSLRKYLWRVVMDWGSASGSWHTDPFTPMPDLDPPQMLDGLVTRLTDAYGERPVILVDEYDAPTTRYVGSDMDMDPVLGPLCDLYRVLKDDAGRLYGVFVTGITRLARQHLFSAANNFFDVSDDPALAALCGFTEDEVEVCLWPHRQALRELEPGFDDAAMLEQWRDMYNGYRFALDDATPIYNPYTLVHGLERTLRIPSVRALALEGVWPSAWSETAHSALTVRLAADTRQTLPPGVREGAAPPSPSEGSLDNLQHPDFARLMQDTGY